MKELSQMYNVGCGQLLVNKNNEVIAVLKNYDISCGFTKEFYGIIFHLKQKENRNNLESFGHIRFQNGTHGITIKK